MRRRIYLTLTAVVSLAIVLGGCSAPQVGTAEQTSTSAHEQLEEELGAFDITAEQRELAKSNEAGYEPLDAGRGNPNWINTKARYAFARLMEFAVTECQRDMSEGDMAGHGVADGVVERFDAAMDPADETDQFLIDAVDYCVGELGMDKEALLMELTDGIIGDYYPSPSRCLPLTETILNEYLQSTLYNGVDLKGQTQVFPTEGGSAAMCYIFHSLSHNRVLNPGDQIALATPIFTPYLQIPDVNNYGLVSVDVSSTSEEDWDIAEEELAKLEDPSIKAFFLVNPSNPASHALSDATLERLKRVVEKNPDLIILTDDVYGTFVSDFQTVYSVLPHNTILVYSYSKLYGATGWRIGMIAMNEDNVVDRLIDGLPNEDKAELAEEYDIVASNPDEMPFIERLCADSRSIGLYHTSGLSTPSQVFMDLLSLTHLINPDDDPYIEQSKAMVHERYVALMDALGLEPYTGRENAQYYVVVDVNELLRQRYGDDFVAWRREAVSDIDFLNDLAKKEGVVLMYGPGFDAPEGCVRISLANLNKDDYVEIARRMGELMDEYYAQYEEETSLAAAA
ncbi:MAG: bifunctional aspartate transaminase/aspartate 4-decarboxylase [Atopobiaceae bacterium]|nr:bifunctional aspartate transaminase/aspartate 4-decarboxylase [Atopobiaceae bacterium]